MPTHDWPTGHRIICNCKGVNKCSTYKTVSINIFALNYKWLLKTILVWMYHNVWTVDGTTQSSEIIKESNKYPQVNQVSYPRRIGCFILTKIQHTHTLSKLAFWRMVTGWDVTSSILLGKLPSSCGLTLFFPSVWRSSKSSDTGPKRQSRTGRRQRPW